MNRKKNYGMSIGSSSILLIFIILCLVSFAALSLSSAIADRKLTEKSAEKITQYYEAHNVAEQKLAKLDERLAALYATSASEEDYFSQTETYLTFCVSVSDTQTLNVTLQVLYPQDDSGPFYQILSWEEVTNQDALEYEDTLPVIE